MIVAAVAGLAALAVVLVQNVVSDTSEQIEGSSARVTAAEIAASSIVSEAKTCDHEDEPQRCSDWPTWQRHFDEKCRRLEITYGDAGITVTPRFLHHNTMDPGSEPGSVTVGDGYTGNPPAAANPPATKNNAIAGCLVS